MFSLKLSCLRKEWVLVEQLAKGDYVGLRQEAIDLQEYSNAKLERVTRYLGVLADKTRRLGQLSLPSFCSFLRQNKIRKC